MTLHAVPKEVRKYIKYESRTESFKAKLLALSNDVAKNQGMLCSKLSEIGKKNQLF